MIDIKDLLLRFPQNITFSQLYRTASKLMSQEQSDEAEQIFRFLIENKDGIDSHFIGASYFKLGEIAQGRGQSRTGETCYRHCLEYIPHHIRAAAYLGENRELLEQWWRIRHVYTQVFHAPQKKFIDTLDSLQRKHFLIHEDNIEQLEPLILEFCLYLESIGQLELSKTTALFFLNLFMHSLPLVAYLKDLILKPAGYTVKGKHLVSIIIPYYNGHEFVAETLDSLRTQSYRKIEVFIVDDGSEKKSREQLEALVKQFLEFPIQILDVKTRRKGPRRNLAVDKARGDFILPLDCDDQIAPQYIEKTVAAFEVDPALDVVNTGTIIYGAQNGLGVKNDLSTPAIYCRNLANVTALIKKSSFNDVGAYREELPGYEDWELWIRFAKTGKRFKRIPEPLFFYRQSTASRGHLSRDKDFLKRKTIMSCHPDIYRMPEEGEMPLLEQNFRYIPACFLKPGIAGG
jgi:Glycosyl transferase family 2